VIIFGSVRFLSKKVTKPNLFFLKKTATEPKVVQTDRVRFFRTKTSSNRFGWVGLGFGSVFSGLVLFFRFSSVFLV
jgi:hypothetical protein